MAPILRLLSVVVGVLALSTPTLAKHRKPTTTAPPNTSFLNCATKTVTTDSPTCPPFTEICAHPDCILESTIHLNCDCPTVGLVFTSTDLLPCQTACRGSCATDYVTVATPCPVKPTPY